MTPEQITALQEALATAQSTVTQNQVIADALSAALNFQSSITTILNDGTGAANQITEITALINPS